MKRIITLLALTPLLSYSQTKDSVYNYLLDINVKYPETVLKQAILETGNFTSYSCKVRKNLFGITIKGKLHTFDNWKQSCDSYLTDVQYKYKSGDYDDFLFELPYATDKNYIKKLNGIRL
jgi:uncharacterized FlgJ-related protein